ncbi:Diuretic hormone 31 [Carabus blaptoides fortunei]
MVCDWLGGGAQHSDGLHKPVTLHSYRKIIINISSEAATAVERSSALLQQVTAPPRATTYDNFKYTDPVMQTFGSAIRTTSFILGVLLCVIATLDAAPTARLSGNAASGTLPTTQNVFTAEKCAQLLFNELNIDYQLVLNILRKTVTKPDDMLNECALLSKIIIQIMHPNFYSEFGDDEPQRLEILEMLARLGQNMIRDDLENSKRLRRTVADFGFGRGFSGKLEAMHRLGYDVATDPRGPGRKRSDNNDNIDY